MFRVRGSTWRFMCTSCPNYKLRGLRGACKCSSKWGGKYPEQGSEGFWGAWGAYEVFQGFKGLGSRGGKRHRAFQGALGFGDSWKGFLSGFRV